MILLGQAALLIALIAAGYASFAAYMGSRSDGGRTARGAVGSSIVTVVALTAVMLVLAHALLLKDFRFAYVAEYSDERLPWQYSLSALWVGQAGSLLLWTWLLGMVVLAFLFQTRQLSPRFRCRAHSILMAYVFFLTVVIVFAADPMKQSLTASVEGIGLSPLLMHPAMLIHPPIVFLGYAAWAVPFALALAVLGDPSAETQWLRTARTWTLFAWVVLGTGIILGGNWAYEELGWGGYWAWDPVENGSLIPWLTGTALIHCLMGWQYRGVLKRASIALAVATFTLCNFATFLTRSGIFSSLHAFSRSPIGWAFLVVMIGLTMYGTVAIFAQRVRFAPDRSIRSVWSRESLIVIANCGLLLLTAVTIVGTLMVPLSDLLLGHKIVVGLAFFNNVLIPIGLMLLCTNGAVPLLRWGVAPSIIQRRLLLGSVVVGCVTGLAAGLGGERNVLTLTVLSCAGFSVAVLGSALWLDTRRRQSVWLAAFVGTLQARRQQYAGYVMHLGFTCLAVGIAGSSLGSIRENVTMREGETISWSGYTVHLAKTRELAVADTLIGDVQLEFSRNGENVCTLFPAQHFHRQQNEWTTEVAIHSTWSRDLYTILLGAAGLRKADLTFVLNPLVRWIWLGSWLFVVGAAARLWPASRSERSPQASRVARPKCAALVQVRSQRVRA
ncbi:MAG: heme lyase CcmF/NrfE family subunit [Pirellulaceae bacterium]